MPLSRRKKTTEGQDKSNPNQNSKRVSENLTLELRRRILEAHNSSDHLRTSATQGTKDTESLENLAKLESGRQDVTVTLKLTRQEAAVINEYARICGQTIPELIRKALIREATLADGYGADDPQYEYEVNLTDGNGSPRSISSDYSYVNQRQQLEDTYNYIRSILGWRKIKF